MNPQQYAIERQDEFLDELIDWLKISSISTTPDYKTDVQRAADWLARHMAGLGLETQIFETPGNPIVFGRRLQAVPDAPTVLVYGHYDVQPPDPLDAWQTPPFEPSVRNGSLYARGAADDKGQLFIHLKAAQSILHATGTLPVNLKFVVEGEEEIGSPNLKAFVESHRDLLAADVAVISDTHGNGLDQPTIIYALRGLVYMELEVRGPATDLHSGIFGGAVHNPAQALCEIIARLHDSDGRVAIPGFYDRVRALDHEERAEIARLPYTDEDVRRETGVPASWGEAGYTLRERVGARPTLEINGIIGGWTGQGGKTVIPAKALAKVSCRLVADQDPLEIFALIQDFVAQITPPTVTSEVRLLPGRHGHPAIVDRHAPAVEAAIAAYEEGWGARPIFAREGGSIPVVVDFQRVLGAPVILMGFGLPDDNLHAPNEKFSLEAFRRGIATAISFYQRVAKPK